VKALKWDWLLVWRSASASESRLVSEPVWGLELALLLASELAWRLELE